MMMDFAAVYILNCWNFILDDELVIAMYFDADFCVSKQYIREKDLFVILKERRWSAIL